MRLWEIVPNRESAHCSNHLGEAKADSQEKACEVVEVEEVLAVAEERADFTPYPNTRIVARNGKGFAPLPSEEAEIPA